MKLKCSVSHKIELWCGLNRVAFYVIKDHDITCAVSGRGQIVLGGTLSVVHSWSHDHIHIQMGLANYTLLMDNWKLHHSKHMTTEYH